MVKAKTKVDDAENGTSAEHAQHFTANAVASTSNGNTHHTSIPRNTFSYHPVTLSQTDALPYYDRELDSNPGLRAQVDALIAAEQNSMPSMEASSSRLPPAYEPFSTRPDLRAELDRVASGKPPAQALDTRRYTLPAPEAGHAASVQEWQDAVDNSGAQLGHMEVRLKNIELMKKYGSNAWRLSNFQQEQDIRAFTEAVDALKADTNELNRLRQKDQTEAGAKLATLEKRWTELISRGLQLEVANITTQDQVDLLHSKKRKLESELQALDST